MHSVKAVLISPLLALFLVSSPGISFGPIDGNTNDTTLRNNQTQTEQMGQWKTYRNDRAGFSVEYPQQWLLTESSDGSVQLGSADPSSPNRGFFGFKEVPASGGRIVTPDEIEEFTDYLIKDTLAAANELDVRLTSDANMTKYQIDGEKAGAFTADQGTEGESLPVITIETVPVIHNGKSYWFAFGHLQDEFNAPEVTELREHMFNSIKWLNGGGNSTIGDVGANTTSETAENNYGNTNDTTLLSNQTQTQIQDEDESESEELELLESVQWKIYSNNRSGFSFEHPEPWLIREFESGRVDVVSPDVSTSNVGFRSYPPIPVPELVTAVTELTNVTIDFIDFATKSGSGGNFSTRVIENPDPTKYIIDGEDAETFTYVLENLDGTPVLLSDVVTTMHNGIPYVFESGANPASFAGPALSGLREHMFNSIRWLDGVDTGISNGNSTIEDTIASATVETSEDISVGQGTNTSNVTTGNNQNVAPMPPSPSSITNEVGGTPTLGADVVEVTPEIAEAMNLTQPTGVLVTEVDIKGPAKKGGIRGGVVTANVGGQDMEIGGDVIQKIDNKTVNTLDEIISYLNTKRVGDTVQVSIERRGMTETIPVQLEGEPTEGISTTDAAEPENLVLYENPDWGISIQYPSNWRASTSGLSDYTDLIAFYSPLQDISDIPASFKISVTNYDQFVSVVDIKNFTSTLLNQSQQFSIISSEDTTLAGYPAYRIVIEIPFQNSSLTIYSMNIWNVVGKEVYGITYEGTESVFNQYLPEVSRMLDSFLINP